MYLRTSFTTVSQYSYEHTLLLIPIQDTFHNVPDFFCDWVMFYIYWFRRGQLLYNLSFIKISLATLLFSGVPLMNLFNTDKKYAFCSSSTGYCPTGTTRYGAFCYKTSKLQLSFATATKFCEAQGYQLTSIHSLGEQNFHECKFSLEFVSGIASKTRPPFAWTVVIQLTIQNWQFRVVNRRFSFEVIHNYSYLHMALSFATSSVRHRAIPTAWENRTSWI